MEVEEIDRLVENARNGDEAALSELFELYRDRLHRMIQLRMDRRIQTRVDVSDVLQEAYVDLASQLANYAKDPKLPFFLWLRRLTGQRLAKTHRFHLGQQRRDLARETRIDQARPSDASSVIMASQLIGQFTSVVGVFCVEKCSRKCKKCSIHCRIRTARLLRSGTSSNCRTMKLRRS